MQKSNRRFKKNNKPEENTFQKELSFMLKEDPENPNGIEGIAYSFTTEPDSWGDIFETTALDDEVGKTVPILPNHQWDLSKALGSTTLGKNESGEITFKGVLNDTPGAEAIKQLKASGVPLKVSIGGKYEKILATDIGRRVLKASIDELSIVLFGANPGAKVTKKENQEEQMPRDQFIKMLEEQGITGEAFKKMLKEFDEAAKKLAKNEGDIESFGKKLNELEAELKKTEGLNEKMQKLSNALDDKLAKGIETPEAMIKNHRGAVEEYLRKGTKNENMIKIMTTSPTADPSVGGVLIDQEYESEIVKTMKEVSPAFADARTITMGADSRDIRVRNPFNQSVAGQGEGAAPPASRDLNYSVIKLEVSKLTSTAEISQELIDDAEYNMVQEIEEAAGEDFGAYVGVNIWTGIKDAVTGTGKNKFVGINVGDGNLAEYRVYTAAAVEYPNGGAPGDLTEAELVAGVSMDDLILLPSTMTKQNRVGGKYYVSTQLYHTLRTKKTNTGAYIYTDNLQEGPVSKFNGYVIEEDPYMTADKPAFFGKMSEFYAVGSRKGIYTERDKDVKNDLWNMYTRARMGGNVRKTSAGRLLEVKTVEDPTP